jgi:hypothetical protein
MVLAHASLVIAITIPTREKKTMAYMVQSQKRGIEGIT